MLVYELSSPSQVGISLYNFHGQLVSVPMPKVHQETGHYQLELVANNLMPGIYFISLQTDKGYTTEKIILLK